MTEAPIKFLYTNYRGETAMRTVQPVGIEFGSTAWHPEPQWLLHGVDLEKGEGRAFALCDCDFTLPATAAIAAEADAEIARLRAALSNLVEDLNARAVGGFVDCGASVWMDANAALATGAGEGGE